MIQVKQSGTSTKYDVEALRKRDKRVKTKSQKICRSYREKTGSGVFLSPPSWIGLNPTMKNNEKYCPYKQTWRRCRFPGWLRAYLTWLQLIKYITCYKLRQKIDNISFLSWHKRLYISKNPTKIKTGWYHDITLSWIFKIFFKLRRYEETFPKTAI